MKNAVRKALTLVLTLVFLLSMGMFLKNQLENAAGSSSYNEALALATSAEKKAETPVPTEEPTQPVQNDEPTWVPAPPEEEDPNIQVMEDIDLEALRQVNPDVIGWIWIPDTEVNYPVMQGSDNDYYLNYTWDGSKSIMGSIFMEHQNSPELTDFNTMIYGHNMDNGSMFASLRYYSDEYYWKTHPYVYLRSDQGVYRYEIFSFYITEVEGNAYGIGFATDRIKTLFLNEICRDSVVKTNIRPENTDRILTLSTCSGIGYSTRWVVHAQLPMILTEA